MQKPIKLLFFSMLLASASPAMARNILISNDDGLTANVVALYQALKADGHDVIVSIPCTQQSGMGGALKILAPIEPLTSDCTHGGAKAGSHGVGQITHPQLPQDFYYVNSTPVMALLYGIDVVGQARWGAQPDLILSGPNIGRNAGHIVVSSGTVSNVQYGLMRGIPAIALSAGMNSESGEALSQPISTAIAQKSVDLIRYLDKASGGKALLPPSVGLNVNFPDDLADAKWTFANIGTYSNFTLKFVPDLRAAFGKPTTEGQAPVPGLFASLSEPEPQTGQLQDEAYISAKNIAISALQIAYDAPEPVKIAMADYLDGLLQQPK